MSAGVGRTGLNFCFLQNKYVPLQTRTKQLVVTYRAPSVCAGKRGSLAGTASAILARSGPHLPARSRSVGAAWAQVPRSPVTATDASHQQEDELRDLRAQLERSRKGEWEALTRLRQVERALGCGENEGAEECARGLRAENARLRAQNGALQNKLDEAAAELRARTEESLQSADAERVLKEKNAGLEARAAELEARLEKLTARWERGGGRDAELEELRRRVKLYEEQRLGSEKYVEERVRERLEGLQA